MVWFPNVFIFRMPVFLVGFESSDSNLLQQAHDALLNPKWPLALGRKSYVPAEPVWLPEGLRKDENLKEALMKYPWITRGNAPHQLLFSFESTDFFWTYGDGSTPVKFLWNGVLGPVLSFQNGYCFPRRLLMLLHKLYLNLRCKEARRDVADPYEMHSTLCRAFSAEKQKCPPGLFLWRLEPETTAQGMPKVLIQSVQLPEWSRIGVDDWFAQEPSSPIDIKQKLMLSSDALSSGMRLQISTTSQSFRTPQWEAY